MENPQQEILIVSATSPTRETIIKLVIKAINYAKRIIYLLLMSSMKLIERNIKQMVSLGMKMNNLRKVILGKVGFDLILIELLKKPMIVMIF